MNANTIGIIIRREYLNRVKKKSFLILTFVAPILFVRILTYFPQKWRSLWWGRR